MIREFLEQNSVPYDENVSLNKKTWIKTGGVCGFYVTPNTILQLEQFASFLYQNNIDFEVVGATSNCYFLHDYSPKVVISTLHMNRIVETDSNIVCDCGVLVSNLARECVKKGYKGFSGLVNLPGTISAAIYGNAGCYGCKVTSILKDICVLTYNSSTDKVEVKKLNIDDLGLSHRSSIFKRKEYLGTILSVTLKKELSDPKVEIEKAEHATLHRKATQESPVRNLGSVYMKLVYRKNLRNIIAYSLKTMLRVLHIANDGMTFYKHLQLWLYGYRCLDKYISDKNINTFIWADSDAEKMFPVYQEFMGKVYSNPQLEIEIKQ